MYAPSKEQADADREAAYAARVPHGYVAPGAAAGGDDDGKVSGRAMLELTVVSDLVRKGAWVWMCVCVCVRIVCVAPPASCCGGVASECDDPPSSSRTRK